MARPSSKPRFRVQPLTASTWRDFETLFGERGASGGCWCMWWHETRAEWNRNKGDANKRLMRAKVDGGEVTGLIAYLGDEPVGWISVMPRESYSGLRASRMLKLVDRAPAWSAPCFFIHKDHRRSGVAEALLRAAAKYARSHGATILEGYPIVAGGKKVAAAFAWTGFLPIFERAGFAVCAHPSTTRAIVRIKLK